MPEQPSFRWEKYGVNWRIIDAPPSSGVHISGLYENGLLEHIEALEAENARLRKVIANPYQRLNYWNVGLLANMHEAEENWLESIQSLEVENEWLRKVVNVTRSYLYDNNATQGAIFDALEELDRLGITRDA